MNRMPTRWLALAGVALLASCAQSNGDINRVQPNVLKKADLLDGQWYFRNTVTWTPATTAFTFAGQSGDTDKLVWEIQERTLVGYRSYAFIPGLDQKVEPSSKPSGTTTQICDAQGKCVGGQQYFGAPMVAYRIESHFDIQRNYNPSTGETGNIIQENSSDRPWNQREYMRVDWSANLIGKDMGTGSTVLLNPAGATDINAWIQTNEPNTDRYDWPVIEYGADKKLSYMDFTGRYVARPDSVFIEGYGDIPACWLYTGYRYDCTSQEIRMRTAMSKVDPDKTNQYEPLVYGNDLMNKFGFFRTERLNYDRKFGTTESAIIRLANRHRIWEKAYETDADGHPVQTKPLAFSNRSLKPIVYYVTPASRQGGQANYVQYLKAARGLEKDWDVAFRRAVATAQGIELSTVPQVLFVCENPVPANDTLTGQPTPAACGKVGFEAKHGDLRYSFMNTVSEPVANGLLGIAQWASDPETGEIISATANNYTAGMDSQVQYVIDIINAITGEKSIDELVSGQDVLDYMSRNPNYALNNLSKKTGHLDAELQDVVQTYTESKGAFEKPAARTAAILQSLKTSGGLPVYSNDRARVAADMLQKNPELEALILDNPEIQQDLMGLMPPPLAAKAMADKGQAREAARSVLTRVTDSLEYKKRRLEWATSGNRCMILQEFFNRELLGIATQEQTSRAARIVELVAQGNAACDNQASCTQGEARNIATEEMRDRLQVGIWRGIGEHEIGHSFGLRHNFQGSFDTVNFHDQWWQVKQQTLGVLQGGELKVPRTPGDLKAASDGTEIQLARRMFDYEYSSVMDYAWPMILGVPGGVGKYDMAAILFAYSGGREPGYVEVFESARKEAKTFPASDGTVLTIDGAGHDLPIINAQHLSIAVPNYTERFHYSTVPLHFGDGNDLETTLSDGIKKLSQRKLVKWSDVKKERERVTNLLRTNPNPTLADLGNAYLEVPYMFCSDEAADGPVLSCNRWDRGTDYFEMARAEIQDYWNGYFFNHFKRDRYWFSSSGAYNSAAGTFYGLANIYKHWVFQFYGQNNPGKQTLTKYTFDPIMQDTWTMAVIDSANALLSVMSVPAAGLYMYRNAQSAPNGIAQWDVISEGNDFDQLNDVGRAVVQDYYKSYYGASSFATLKRGEGRRMYSRYDFKSGAGFQERMLEAGHYNDQMGALIAAVIPGFDYLGADTDADMNRYNIPYYLVFKKEFGDTFASLWSANEAAVRPTMYFTKDDAGKVTTVPALAHKVPIKGEDYVVDFKWPKLKDLPCSGTLVTNCLTSNQSGAPANIQLTWTARIMSLYYGLALFNVNYDLDYAKQNEIFKLGGSEQVSIDLATSHAFEVEDAITGARYVAIERNSACTPESDRPVVCSETGPGGAACLAKKAACPQPFSTPAVRLAWMASQYLQVVRNPAICPMPQYLREVGDTACMPADEAQNPALVEQRRRDYTDAYVDKLRDMDIARGFFSVFGKAF